MKKVVSALLSSVLLTLCACTPVRTAQLPSYYSVQINGNDVSVAPFLYYADYNRLYYSVLQNDICDLVHDQTVSDFLTYYVIKSEAMSRGLTLSETDRKMLDYDYQNFLSARHNPYLSESDVREIQSVYYFQKQIRDAFLISDEEIFAAFCDEYCRFRYCLVAKYDEKGQKYLPEALDELRKKAYNIYVSVSDGSLCMEDAVKMFSSEYEETEQYSDEEKAEAEERNRILSQIGFLVDSEGYTDYSEYPIPDDVFEALRNAEIGAFFFAENDIGYWVCEKMDPTPLIEDKCDLLTFRLRTKAFTEWLDAEKEKLTYSFDPQMVEEYIYLRP